MEYLYQVDAWRSVDIATMLNESSVGLSFKLARDEGL